MEDQKFDGGPAFPKAGLDPWNNAKTVHVGMTMRDYFAAKALQGILANPGGVVQANSACGWSLCNCTLGDVAEFSYQLAGAMLKARSA
jgi:hypothetical protein